MASVSPQPGPLLCSHPTLPSSSDRRQTQRSSSQIQACGQAPEWLMQPGSRLQPSPSPSPTPSPAPSTVPSIARSITPSTALPTALGGWDSPIGWPGAKAELPFGEESKHPFVYSLGFCSRGSGDKSQVGRGASCLDSAPATGSGKGRVAAAGGDWNPLRGQMRSARLRSGPTALLPPPLALLPSRPPPPGGRTRPPSCGPCHGRLECQCCPSPPPPVGSLELRGWAWGEAAAPAAWLPCAWCCPASAIDDSSPWAPGAGGITPLWSQALSASLRASPLPLLSLLSALHKERPPGSPPRVCPHRQARATFTGRCSASASGRAGDPCLHPHAPAPAASPHPPSRQDSPCRGASSLGTQPPRVQDDAAALGKKERRERLQQGSWTRALPSARRTAALHLHGPAARVPHARPQSALSTHATWPRVRFRQFKP